MNKAILLLILPFLASCRSLSREVNSALPPFLRSRPGGDEMKVFTELRAARTWSAEELERQARLAREVREAYTQGDWEECAELAVDYTEEFPVSEHDQQVRFVRADSLCRDDEWDLSFDAFKEFLALHPVSVHSEAAMQMLYRMGLECIEGRRTSFFGIFSRRARGEEILTALVETFPGGSRAADAQWALARHALLEEDWHAAAEKFALLSTRWPESEWSSAALYFTAWCRYRTVRGAAYDGATMQQAREGFERYLSEARHQGWAAQAKSAVQELRELEAGHLMVVAEWYLDQDRPWSARYWLNKLAVQHSTTEAGRRARQQLSALGDGAAASGTPDAK